MRWEEVQVKWCLTVNLDFGAEIVMDESMKLQVLQFLCHREMCPGKYGRVLRDRFGEHRRAVAKNNANQPFDSANHSLSDMQIRALVPQKSGNASHFQTWNTPPPMVSTSDFLTFSSQYTSFHHLTFLCHPTLLFSIHALFFALFAL